MPQVISDFNEKWWKSIQASAPAHGASPPFTPPTSQETMKELTAQLFQKSSAQIMSAPNYWNSACIIWKEVFLLLVRALSSKASEPLYTLFPLPGISHPFVIPSSGKYCLSDWACVGTWPHAPSNKSCLNFMLTSSRPAFTTRSWALGTGPVNHVPQVPITGMEPRTEGPWWRSGLFGRMCLVHWLWHFRALQGSLECLPEGVSLFQGTLDYSFLLCS